MAVLLRKGTDTDQIGTTVELTTVWHVHRQ